MTLLALIKYFLSILKYFYCHEATTILSNIFDFIASFITYEAKGFSFSILTFLFFIDELPLLIGIIAMTKLLFINDKLF